MKSFYFFILLFCTEVLQSQIITTVAGNGTYGKAGNGGLATSAQLAWQIGVTTDKLGNIYIADHDNNVIRKVNTSGIISIFAGTGILGYSGDNGLALNAKLYHPSRLTFDNSNNLYLVDQNADVIRKIDINGIITSITGNLPIGYSGDGGNVIGAQFQSITGISFDKIGNMFISDTYNQVIRKVDLAGIISTVVGNGTSGFSGDGGLAISAKLKNPTCVVFDNSGNMYISDAGNIRIRKVSTTGVITTYAGTSVFGYNGDGGLATLASIGIPWTIDFDNADNLYIGDVGNNVVRKVDVNGIITTYAGTGVYGNTGDGGLATSALLGEVACVHVDASNNLLISIKNYFYVIKKVTNCLLPNFNSQPSNVSICTSGNATYSVNVANATGYQWQEKIGAIWNNVADNAIYTGATTNSLNITGITVSMNNYQYRCVVTNACGNIYSSNATLTVTTPIVPTLNITTSTNTICQGSIVTFTATPTNGGLTPIYQWKRNGINVGTNSNTYSNNSLVNGHVISCMLISNATCLSTTIANSNNIAMVVNSPLATTISISANSNNICSGTNVDFNASITNGGVSPIYQWKKNSLNVGANSALYSDNTLKNGDIISCVLTSNQTCLISNIATSNDIFSIVNPLLNPSITISSSNNNVCTGTPITFNALTLNSGINPFYQWLKNGITVGTNNATYTDNTLTSTDLISCTLSVSGGCFATPIVTSNTIQSNILQPVLPTATIAATNTSICKGTTVSFTSFITNATPILSYQWKKNGLIVGNTTNTYTTNSIVNGDVIQLSVTSTSNINCIQVATVQSNSLILKVFDNPIVSLNQTNSICSGGNRLLDAGNFSSYQWNDGSSQRLFNINKLGTYYVTVKDNNGCIGSDTVKVSRLLAKPSNFLANDTSICSYVDLLLKPNTAFRNYLWNDGSKSSYLSVSKSGKYSLQVEDYNGCIGADSILVLNKPCLEGFFMPTGFTPNKDGKNDILKPILLGRVVNYEFWIYNRFGQIIFNSKEVSKGWDGAFSGIPQDMNTFVWVCIYQFENDIKQVKKGTVVLIK